MPEFHLERWLDSKKNPNIYNKCWDKLTVAGWGIEPQTSGL